MNTDRYRHPILDTDDRPKAPETPVKPHLAERLREASKPRPFDQAAADAFAKGVHWPVGWTAKVKSREPTPVEANPWRPIGEPSAPWRAIEIGCPYLGVRQWRYAS